VDTAVIQLLQERLNDAGCLCRERTVSYAKDGYDGAYKARCRSCQVEARVTFKELVFLD
jgi:hypothetical protein